MKAISPQTRQAAGWSVTPLDVWLWDMKWSRMDLAISSGIPYQSIINISQNSAEAWSEAYQCYKKLARRISDFVGISPYELWPIEVDKEHSPRRTLEMRAEDAASDTDPFEAAARNELRRNLAKVLEHLNVREIQIITRRFGLGGLGERYDDDQTLERLALVVGVTRERVRQIETSALKALRHPSRSNMLRSFWGASEARPPSVYTPQQRRFEKAHPVAIPILLPHTADRVTYAKHKTPRKPRCRLRGCIDSRMNKSKWCAFHASWACCFCGALQQVYSVNTAPKDCPCGCADYVRLGAATKVELAKWTIRGARGYTAKPRPKKEASR